MGTESHSSHMWDDNSKERTLLTKYAKRNCSDKTWLQLLPVQNWTGLEIQERH